MSWTTRRHVEPVELVADPHEPDKLARVEVHALRAFAVDGRRVEMGEKVTLEAWIAHGLCAVGKARLADSRTPL